MGTLIDIVIANKFKVGVLFIITICVISRYHKAEPLVQHELLKYLRIQANVSATTIPRLKETLKETNRRCEVRNSVAYGPVGADTVVIVAQVHRDIERLQYLIVSLAQVHHISEALLVFSHSYYDENINALIRLIDFCMVLQIYYPNSVQAFPDTFPGACGDGEDDRGVAFARDANMTERKHHWWWTATFVFEKLPWADVHREMVIFIDEASYVLPDLLHMFRFAKRSLAYVPDAEMVSLGRSLAAGLRFDRLTVDSWRPHYGKGIAFNATVWRKISALGDRYCEYDDTAWSHSLLHLLERFPRGRAVMVATMAPRVVSTAVFRGGWHAAFYLRLTLHTRLLFPETVSTIVLYGWNGKLFRNMKSPRKGNGGWRDRRDIELCLGPMTQGDYRA